jgi:hypothetical protein
LVHIACGILLALSAATVESSWSTSPIAFIRTCYTVSGTMLSRSSQDVALVMSLYSVAPTPGLSIGTTTQAILPAGTATPN